MIPPNVEAAAGFTAGFVTTAALYPLDVIKVRFQSGIQRAGTFQSLVDLAKPSTRGQLYRGFLTGLTGASLSWCQYFWLYSSIKQRMQAQYHLDRLSPAHHLVASFVSGCIVQATLCPLWVVKVNQQVGIFPSFFSGLRTLYASEGVRGFYRGLVPGIWSCMHGAVQFAVYEEVKSALSVPGLPPSVINTLAATFVSKTVATLVTSPIEVVKVRTRLASAGNSAGVFETVTGILKSEGVSGFYRGVVPALVRLLPAQFLMFSTYEGVKAKLAHG